MKHSKVRHKKIRQRAKELAATFNNKNIVIGELIKETSFSKRTIWRALQNKKK